MLYSVLESLVVVSIDLFIRLLRGHLEWEKLRFIAI